VQVATDGATGVTVRDSKDPQGPVLMFAAGAWTDLVTAITADAYDLVRDSASGA
jgi:hypothetical protein